MADLQDAAVVEGRIVQAIAMIERGAYVFPLSRNSKMPLVPKAQGGEGFKDARPDPVMARTFLSNAGQPNYGVVFPEGSEVFVLDLDGGGDAPRPAWREDWQRLYERYGPPGVTFIVRTPSGGRHAYYRWRTDLYGAMPVGDEMLGWTVRKPWKGYLVGPGSVVNGIAYESAGGDTIADFPEPWAKAALEEKRQPAAAAAGPVISGPRGPGQVQAGHRHAYLRNQARYLVGIGITGEALFAAVSDLNRQLPQPKTADDVRRAIGEAERLFEPDEIEPTGERPRSLDDDLGLLPSRKTSGFPESPAAVAFEGLIGDCVYDLAPGTDASLVGLLGCLMALCGALVPGQAYFHGTQTSSPYVALVGESSVGRKGTAMRRVRDAVSACIESVYVNRVLLDGLNSGEGLVTYLSTKRDTYPYEPTVGLVYEEEYASLLASRGREGSTLDPKMRQAFDGGPLSNRRSNSSDTKSIAPPYWLPALIAITPTELRIRLEAGALQSGSANRWLYLAVEKRATAAVSDEPAFSFERAQALVAARRNALDDQRPIRVMPAVTTILGEYGDYLPTVSVGIAVDLVRRLAVVAFRLALIHALVERSAYVTLEHLDRALALTEYGRAGIPWIFGETIGSPDADLLLRHLMTAGRLTKRAITQEIIRDPIRRQQAIDELVRLGRADVVTVHAEGRGRPRTELVVTTTTGEFRAFRALFRGSAPPVPESLHGMHVNADLSTNGLAQNTHENSTEIARNSGNSPENGTGDWLRPCLDYSAHATKGHRQTPGGWVCDLCDLARNSHENIAEAARNSHVIPPATAGGAA